MSQMQLLLNETTSPAVRKLILQDIDKGEKFIRNNVVDTEYYFLFKSKDTDLLQKRVRQMINGLATCGMNASLASNSDLRLILENFLNGGNTTEFGVDPTEGFALDINTDDLANGRDTILDRAISHINTIAE